MYTATSHTTFESKRQWRVLHGKGKTICKYRYIDDYAVFVLTIEDNRKLKLLKGLDVFVTTVAVETVATMLSRLLQIVIPLVQI